jgi:Predicted endonuclease distantly related to archaeal Holliday junction resolvase and Mrr-like restriction enzymes
MDDVELEEFVKILFETKKYQFREIQESPILSNCFLLLDNSDDIALVHITTNYWKRYNIPISDEIVKTLIAIKNIYEIEKSVIISNSTFSDVAIECAKNNNIKLIDEDELIQCLMKITSFFEDNEVFLRHLDNRYRERLIQDKEKLSKTILNSHIFEIDKMEGVEFEKYLKILYEKDGYNVKTTPISNDYGADLIIQKYDIKTVVQAKRSQGKVGNTAIQEVVAAKYHYEADRAIVITNSYFTDNAKRLAKSNDIELIDRDKLIQLSYNINRTHGGNE